MNLSIIVPAFNEKDSIECVIQRCLEAFSDEVQLIVVDDCSTDGTREILGSLKSKLSGRFELILRDQNGGKSAALKDGLSAVSGDWVAIQDADLEYSPKDLHRMFQSIGDGDVAIYGKRPAYWSNPRRWLFALGVLFFDTMLWVCYGRWIRDHATCYKMIRTSTLRNLKIESNGFEGCIEITAKLFRLGLPIKQLPIGYIPRSSEEGKKLTITYGFRAMAAVWKWRKWVSVPSEETTDSQACRVVAPKFLPVSDSSQ